MSVKYSKFVSDLAAAAAQIGAADAVAIIQNGASRKMLLSALMGADGREVLLRKGATAIEWQYEGDLSWTTLIEVAALKGDPGNDGKPVEMQKSATHVQWRLTGAQSWIDLILIADLKGDPGVGLNGRGDWVATTYNPGDYVFAEGTLNTTSLWVFNGSEPYVSTQPPKLDATHWVELAAPPGKDGANGKPVEMQKSAAHIQWRLEGSATWTDIVALADLKGADGKTVELQKSATHIQWRVAGAADWINLVALADLKGDPGNTGPGVPAGGATGQVLTKKSGSDNDTEWKTPATGGGGGGIKPVITLTWQNSFTLDLTTGENFYVVMAGHTQFQNPSGAVDGQKFNLYIKQHSAGSLTLVNWGAKWKFAGGVKAMTPTANAVDLIEVQYVAALDQFLARQIQAFA